MWQLGKNEMKPNCHMPQNLRLSEWLSLALASLKCNTLYE